MSNSKEWHKHKDSVYHKVKSDTVVVAASEEDKKAFYKDAKLGITFTQTKN